MKEFQSNNVALMLYSNCYILGVLVFEVTYRLVTLKGDVDCSIFQ